ncbi:C6 zinc finger domain containing protein [Pleurostoma richardsiae]|uniref:C6 zinc finger domain containing protein n=1 Tax=Pleurostoma richardsiae TaxID=41990 RepID=A0AA38RQD0_9PEZI|nr:C6 zinc finger domain containing protein [Pleurostoma richardsiae]
MIYGSRSGSRLPAESAPAEKYDVISELPARGVSGCRGHFLHHLRSLLGSKASIASAADDLDNRIRTLEHGGPSEETTPAMADNREGSILTKRLDSVETDNDILSSSQHPERVPENDGTESRRLSNTAEVAVDKVQTDNASILTAVEFLAWGRNIRACYPHRACTCYQHRRYSELVSINSDPSWLGRIAMPVHLEEDILIPVGSARKVIDFHLTNIHWHHNAFHCSTFLHKCEQFWLSGTVDHPLWLALYFAVSSVSLWTLLNNHHRRQELGIEFDEDLVQKQFQAMVNILYEENFLEQLSLYSIQAIVISTRIAHNLGRSDLNATLVGAAVRIAHCLGLHKISDSSVGLSYNEQVELETGKRVWRQLVIQDHFQIPFTDTYVIHPLQFITPLPKNCSDDDMIERDSEVATNSSYVIMLARSAAQIPPLLDGLGPMGARKPIREIYDHVLYCDKEMRASVQRIPVFLLRGTDPGSGNALPWLPLARRTLAISAAEKIIMIHRPVLFHSFQSPAFSKTRTTCVAAAITILREHEQATAENALSIWTHSAFCVTGAVVLGLELFHRTDHTDDTAHRYRQMMISAAERLRKRRCDAIAQRGAILIDTMLAAEEDLVLRLMRTSRQGGSVESRQRQVINDMIGSHEILTKFLASNTEKVGSSPAEQHVSLDDIQATMEMYTTPDFDSWFNEVFAPTSDPFI